MANAPTPIKIGNNILYMHKKGSTSFDPKKDKTETIIIGAEQIYVGVESDRREIAKDKQSGLNYERNAIDAQTIYDTKTQSRKRCFLMLDLETGTRGWYPGSIQVVDIIGDNVFLKAEKSDESEQIIYIPNGTQVKVLDLEYDDVRPNPGIWYKVEHKVGKQVYIGYLRNTQVSKIRYVDPY